MKHFFPVILLLGLSLAASAQQALGPGSGLVSPEINPDHSVTFRYQNPQAKVVQVTGDFLPTRPVEIDFGGRKLVYDAPGVVDMQEGQDGIWTYTSTPLVTKPASSTILCCICCMAPAVTKMPGATWAAPPKSWTTSLRRARPNP